MCLQNSTHVAKTSDSSLNRSSYMHSLSPVFTMSIHSGVSSEHPSKSNHHHLQHVLSTNSCVYCVGVIIMFMQKLLHQILQDLVFCLNKNVCTVTFCRSLNVHIHHFYDHGSHVLFMRTVVTPKCFLADDVDMFPPPE